MKLIKAKSAFQKLLSRIVFCIIIVFILLFSFYSGLQAEICRTDKFFRLNKPITSDTGVVDFSLKFSNQDKAVFFKIYSINIQDDEKELFESLRDDSVPADDWGDFTFPFESFVDDPSDPFGLYKIECFEEGSRTKLLWGSLFVIDYSPIGTKSQVKDLLDKYAPIVHYGDHTKSSHVGANPWDYGDEEENAEIYYPIDIRDLASYAQDLMSGGLHLTVGKKQSWPLDIDREFCLTSSSYIERIAERGIDIAFYNDSNESQYGITIQWTHHDQTHELLEREGAEDYPWVRDIHSNNSNLRDNLKEDNKIYGTAYQKDGYLFVQYFFYYPFDPKNNKGLIGEVISRHSGDLERVVVVINKGWRSINDIINGTIEPEGVLFFHHLPRQAFSYYADRDVGDESNVLFSWNFWDDNIRFYPGDTDFGGAYVEWEAVNKTDLHPHVYVAQGSHGCYFREGSYKVYDVIDLREYAGGQPGTNYSTEGQDPNLIYLPRLSQIDTGNYEFSFLLYSGIAAQTEGIQVPFHEEQIKFPPFNRAWFDAHTYYYIGKAYNNVSEHLSPPEEYELGYYSHTIDDDAIGESSGNGDGRVNPGETIELKVSLQNSGNAVVHNVSAELSTLDPNATITDSFKSYPDISAGDDETCMGHYVFRVASNYPASHTLPLNLDITSDEDSWSDSFGVKVVSATTNHPPELSNPRVRPSSGTESTTFEFLVDYYDPDGDPPDPMASIVYIGDNLQGAMTLKSGSASAGTYHYKTSLVKGSYPYWFLFSDGRGEVDTIYSKESLKVFSDGDIVINIIIQCQKIGCDLGLKYSLNGLGGPWTDIPITGAVLEPVSVPAGADVWFEASTGPNFEYREWVLLENGTEIGGGTASTWHFQPPPRTSELGLEVLYGYTPQDYTISGTVLDESSTPIPAGVDLTLSSAQQTLIKHLDGGNFSFSGVKGGFPVTIALSAEGYAFVPAELNYPCLAEDHIDETITAYAADSYAPLTSLTSAPPAVCDLSSVSFTWTGQDDVTPKVNLLYQYKLDDVDSDWSTWSASTSTSYELANGAYTFWVRAKDEAGNINQAPTNYEFTVNAAPRVANVSRIKRSVWASRITLEMPHSPDQPSNTLIILPEYSDFLDPELVPVTIREEGDPAPLGANEIVAERLSVPAIITKVQDCWKLTLPHTIDAGQSKSYDIVWGKILYFGWHEFVLVPVGFPDGADEQAAVLDENMHLWRCATKRDDHNNGLACDDDSWVFMDMCEKSGIILPEKTLSFIRGQCWGGNTGMRSLFYLPDVFEHNEKLFFNWNEDRYVFDGTDDYQERKFAFSAFDSSGSAISSFNSSYYKRNSIDNPDGLIGNLLWFVGEDWGSFPEKAWFTAVDSSGNVVISKTIFDRSEAIHTRRAYPIGKFVLLVWQRKWETGQGYVRVELAYQVRDMNGQEVIDTKIFSLPLLPDSEEKDDEYDIRSVLADTEGKIWISFTHHQTDQQDESFYIIIGASGTIWRNVTETPGLRRFYYCDREGYIWAKEDDQFVVFDSEDNIIVAPREPVWVPNQSVGQMAANVSASGYRLYDRWSPEVIEIDVPPGANANSLELFDLNMWDNNLHCANVSLKKNETSVWSQSGQFSGYTTADISGVLTQGNNILTMKQDDFLGGQVLITFPYIYRVSGQVTIHGGTNAVTDALLVLGGDASKNTSPNVSGNYSFTALEEGDYTITPSLTEYHFFPSSRLYLSLDSDQTAQDFAGLFETYSSDDDHGLPDWWELTLFGDLEQDGTDDPDEDGLNNLEEYSAGTDPNDWDSDDDSMTDGWEVDYGLDALDGTGDSGPNGDFDNDGWTNYEEYENDTNPADNISPVPTPPDVKEVNPHQNAGVDDSVRIPNDTSFAVRIEDSDGIDITDTASIKFTIDDGVNPIYERGLRDTEVVRTVKLIDDADISVTKLWAVYDRTKEVGLANYLYDTVINIKVDARDRRNDWMSQESFNFGIETEKEHNKAQANLPDTGSVDSNDPAIEGSYDIGTQVNSGDLVGAKIIFNSSEPVPPIFGPTDELPPLDMTDVNAVGVRMNLQPPTVFNTPVKIFIPCPEDIDVSSLCVYLFNGNSWLPLCDDDGNVQTGGEGCMVPDSRVNYSNPCRIEVQLYHFSGVQAGTSENQSPIAEFTADPTFGESPLRVSFDATAAYDPDGTIESYNWDFGDGSTGSGDSTSHEYSSKGTYTVTLTVTDDDGATDTETTTIRVEEKDTSCPIILAVSGSPLEPVIDVLREFRDRFMFKNSVGKDLVKLYYTNSPAIAHFIGNYESLQVIVRWSLLPLVGASWMALHCGPIATITILILLFSLIGVGASVTLRRVRMKKSQG